MKLKTILCGAVLAVSACTMPNALGYKRVFLRGVPQGNDNFSQGWRDGCDTALAIVGTGRLRLVDEKINAHTAERMTHDALYEKGFTVGSGYCTNFLDYNSG